MKRPLALGKAGGGLYMLHMKTKEDRHVNNVSCGVDASVSSCKQNFNVNSVSNSFISCNANCNQKSAILWTSLI